MISLSLKLPDELAQRLEAEARARGLSKSALIREYAEKQLAKSTRKRELTFHDLAKDLCGSVDGCPDDIATNPEYFDDFGQ